MCALEIEKGIPKKIQIKAKSIIKGGWDNVKLKRMRQPKNIQTCRVTRDYRILFIFKNNILESIFLLNRKNVNKFIKNTI